MEEARDRIIDLFGEAIYSTPEMTWLHPAQYDDESLDDEPLQLSLRYAG